MSLIYNLYCSPAVSTAHEQTVFVLKNSMESVSSSARSSFDQSCFCVFVFAHRDRTKPRHSLVVERCATTDFSTQKWCLCADAKPTLSKKLCLNLSWAGYDRFARLEDATQENAWKCQPSRMRSSTSCKSINNESISERLSALSSARRKVWLNTVLWYDSSLLGHFLSTTRWKLSSCLLYFQLNVLGKLNAYMSVVA